MAKKAAKKSTKKSSKKGRPSGFDKLDLEQVRKLALKGFIDKEMADFFGVTEQTWNNWKKGNPDFFESLKSWKDVADAEIERSLYERAKGGFKTTEKKTLDDGGIIITEREATPDTTAQIFWLKNRMAKEWRDKQEVEHSGNFDISIQRSIKSRSDDATD